jgi:hypothetical protein
MAQTFVEFAPRFLGHPLSRGQRAFAQVAFDFIRPGKLPRELRELALKIWGGDIAVPVLARSIAVLCAGRDSGKTDLGIARVAQLALTMPLRPGQAEPTWFLFCDPSQRMSRRDLARCVAYMRRDAAIAACITNETADGADLVRPDGARCRFEAIPAGRMGGLVRGVEIGAASLGEVALFREEGADVSDVATLDAVMPRLLPGGQVIISSTPNGESGLLWDLYQANHGKPSTALVARGSTHDMRAPDAAIESRIELEYKRNPRNAQRELGAEFSAASTQLLTHEQISSCIEKGRTSRKPEGGVDYGMVIDFALKKDNFVALIFHCETRFENSEATVPLLDVVIDEFVIHSPSLLKRALRLVDVDSTIVQLAKRYAVGNCWADQKDFAHVTTLGQAHGFKVLDLPTHVQHQTRRANAFVSRVCARTLRLLDRPEIVREVVDARVHQRAGGASVVEARVGAHDDLLDCLLGAVDPEVDKLLRASGEVERVGASMWGHMTDAGFVPNEPAYYRRTLPNGVKIKCAPPPNSPDFAVFVYDRLCEHQTTVEIERWLVERAVREGRDPATAVRDALANPSSVRPPGSVGLGGVDPRFFLNTPIIH